jgi:hypothetical protein
LTGDQQLFLKRHLLCVAASFCVSARASVVNQNPPHHLGRNAKEMSPTLPLDVTLIYQTQECFIQESGGLQGVTRPLFLYMAMGQSVEF